MDESIFEQLSEFTEKYSMTKTGVVERALVKYMGEYEEKMRLLDQIILED